MGITVADNFKHLSKKFLDDRASFDTLADMKAASDASIPEGFETYCKATDKYYKFLSTNAVDADTGKWRERESGGGGTTDYTALENKPQIEGVTLSGNKTAADLGLAKSNQIPTVPTKVSQLQNDSGFITSSSLPGVYAGDTAGLVPAAGSDNEGKFLDNNGNWTDPLEDLVQNSGGKVLLDIPSNTYSSYILAFNEIIDILDTLSYEELSSIVLRFGLDYYTFGKTKADMSYYSFYSNCITSTDNNFGMMKIMTIAKNIGAHIGRWDFDISSSKAPVYSNQDKTSDAQTSTIQLIDTSVSATMIGKINRSDIYDTTEKVIGKWTDGRPLYQKTIIDTMPSAVNTKKQISAGTTIQDICNVEAILYNRSGQGQAIGSLQGTNDFSKFGKIIINCHVSDYPDTIEIWTSADNWLNKDVMITIRYTKTTDAANSYNYADENDYSTSEKIIGKWIDGKPVYQRTFVENITSSISASTTTNFDFVSNIPNLDNVIKVDLTGKINDTSNVIMPLPLKNATKTDVLTADFYRYKKSGNTPIIELTATAAAAGNSLVAYITVQYTKTS